MNGGEIFNNHKTDNTNNNIELGELPYDKIAINTDFQTSGSKFGITTFKKPQDGEPVIFSRSVDKDYSKYIVSDDSGKVEGVSPSTEKRAPSDGNPGSGTGDC